MPRYKGVGPRIRERLVALGYVQPNGNPDPLAKAPSALPFTEHDRAAQKAKRRTRRKTQ